MSKKFDSYPQIRISPKLAKRVDALREGWEFRVSRNAFVEFLLNDSVTCIERRNKTNSDTQPDSTFKK